MKIRPPLQGIPRGAAPQEGGGPDVPNDSVIKTRIAAWLPRRGSGIMSGAVADDVKQALKLMRHLLRSVKIVAQGRDSRRNCCGHAPPTSRTMVS